MIRPAAGYWGPNVATPATDLGSHMATRRTNNGVIGGISLGGLIVIAGILVAILWKVWLGIIIILIGLIAFGGFVKGKWY